MAATEGLSKAACQGPNQPSPLKVVILGDKGVGKSCLRNQFVNNHFGKLLGVEVLKKNIEIAGNAYTLQIYVDEGQERSKAQQAKLFRGSQICLLVYSIDNRDSFNYLNVAQRKFISYMRNMLEDLTFLFLVVGNKVDIPEEKRAVTTDEARAWCLDNGSLLHIETSAKNATNVEKAFVQAVETWSRQEETHDTCNRVLEF